MANAIVKINRRAKAIQRAQPGKAWKACIQQASREYRATKGGKKKTVKRSAPKKSRRSAPKKTSHSPRSGGSSLSKATPAQLKSALLRQLKEKEDRAVLQKYHAKKKRVKNKIQKRIVAIRKEARKLS